MRPPLLRSLVCACGLLSVAAACDDSNAGAQQAGSGGTNAAETDLTQIDTSQEMDQFLNAGSYRNWPADAEDFPSSEHAPLVRIYVNPNAADAIRSNASTLPKGAASVKELLADGAARGWAVWIKLDAESAGGMGFYWWEGQKGGTASQGRGKSECLGCHVDGRDFLLAAVRLPAE